MLCKGKTFSTAVTRDELIGVINTYDSCMAHRGADTRYLEVKMSGEEGESESELFSPIKSIHIWRRQCQK